MDNPKEALEDISELRQEQHLKECEEYLKESRRIRDIVAMKSKGMTRIWRINPTPISNKALGKQDRNNRKRAVPAEKESKTAGNDETEIQRWREAGECFQCAWTLDRKGNPRVKDCVPPVKLHNGTAPCPKAKHYLQQPNTKEASSDAISSEVSSDDSL